MAEAMDGTTRELPWTALPIQDPRTEKAYLIRTVGLASEVAAFESASALQVQLADGDLLRGKIVGGEGEILELELMAGVQLELDIGELESLLFTDRLPPGLDLPIEAAREGDRLYRLSGNALDRIDGTVEEFLVDGVRFDSIELGSRVFPWAELAALFVEVFGEPAQETASDQVSIAVDLVDGSRVRGELSALEVEGVRMRVAGRSEVFLAWSQVYELMVDDGTLRFLSELEPLQEEGRGAPFGDELGMVWPYQQDRSVVGAALSSSGRTYTRGLGVHAPSRLTWELDGSWTHLRGSVAIDDSSLLNAKEARGSVLFRIHADGREVWKSRLVRGGDAPVAFPTIDLAGVRRLVLEADPGEDFRGDRANWLRPILVGRP